MEIGSQNIILKAAFKNPKQPNPKTAAFHLALTCPTNFFLIEPLQPHLFRPETEASRTARTCGLLRARSPPVWHRCGSCCSWGWWWPRSWGSAAAWGRTHSGTPSCVRGWSPGHQWVLLLLYPYIGHSPFSTFCGWREKEMKLVRRWNNSSRAVSIGEIMIQYSIISELPLRVTEPCEKSFN